MTDRGTLEIVDGRPVLRFERRYARPIDRVWKAVTDAEEMRAWFPSNVEGRREVGAELAFSHDVAESDAGLPLFRGEIKAFDPPRLFEFTWGGELLRFELERDGDGTRLRFTQVVSHRSVAGRNASGWHVCLAALDAQLGGDGKAAQDGWELYDEYAIDIGLPLGTPNADGSMAWELASHVDADEARRVLADPGAMEVWAGRRIDEPFHWEVASAEHGSVYRITHPAIGANAELAAQWHARLVQLDLYMAAGLVHEVDAAPWLPAYRRLLAGT